MFKTVNGGKLPERATNYSAGFDVFANENVTVYPGDVHLIGLGIKVNPNMEFLCNRIYGEITTMNEREIMSQFYLSLHLRSSMRLKGLSSNGTGIIDFDYRDEIKIVVSNATNQLITIRKGDKIGQLIFQRHQGWLMPIEYTKNEKRVGGFGSTGSI